MGLRTRLIGGSRDGFANQLHFGLQASRLQGSGIADLAKKCAEFIGQDAAFCR